MRRIWVFLFLLIGVAGRGNAMQAQDDFKLVPAQLFQARGGLPNTFAKLKSGKPVTVAYFGGSITAMEGWRTMTFQWFQKTWPKTAFTQIDATIGGTGSDLGVFRMQQDVLAHKPDLIFVEFAVNDGGADPASIYRGMEGIVRQAWKADPRTDICFVYTFANGQQNDLDKGLFPRASSADDRLADYYGIPSVSVAMKTAELARAGKLNFTPQKDAAGKEIAAPEGVILFSHDGVHPDRGGHEVYTQVVTDALKQMEPNARSKAHKLPKPMQADNWEQAKLVPLEPSILSAGWVHIDTASGLGQAFHNRMPAMWEARKPGETLTFRFKGTAVKLYDIIGPDGGMALITVDGKARTPQALFDSYCSYHRLATLWIDGNLPDAIHTVKVEVSPEQPDRHSVTDIESKKPGFDPARYNGTVLRFGGIMILGDLVP